MSDQRGEGAALPVDAFDALLTETAEMLLSIRTRDIRNPEHRELLRHQLLRNFKAGQECVVDLIIIRAQRLNLERSARPPGSG